MWSEQKRCAMWDWDEKPSAAQPAPTLPWRLLVRIGAGGASFLVLLGLVVQRVAGPDPADRTWSAPAAEGSAPTEEDDMVVEGADLLLGNELSIANPSPLNLATGEALVLRNRDELVRVTPGQVAASTGDCGAVTVPVTVDAGRRAADFGPSAFRLGTVDGQELPALDCGVAGAGSVTLAFAAAVPARLIYAPGGGTAQAVWRLA